MILCVLNTTTLLVEMESLAIVPEEQILVALLVRSVGAYGCDVCSGGKVGLKHCRRSYDE